MKMLLGKQREILSRFLKEKSNSALLRNIILVGSVTFTLSLLGFYKETLVASSFGLSKLLDSFYIAFLIPTFIQSVFLSSLTNIFIPNYVAELAKKKESDKGSFQSVTLVLTLSIVLVFTVITLVFEHFFLEMVFKGHDAHFYHLIRIQLHIMTPCLFFWGITSLLGGLLDIEGKFIFSSIQPIFISICIILSLFFFKEELAEKLLAIGTLVGSILGSIFMIVAAIYYGLISVKIPKLNSNSRTMIIQLPPKIASGFLTVMNRFVDQFFAAQLAVGSISAINYGVKIPTFILSLSMIAMGNVLLPHFSKKINEDRLGAFNELFKILKVLFAIGLVTTSIIFIFSYDIIELLFERNEFNSDNTFMVSRIQQIILIYVPFYLCGNLLGKFLTSINKNSFMAWVSLYNLVANIIFNIIFVKMYGVYGLAVSTSLVITVSSFIYLFFTYKQYKGLVTQ